MTKIDDFLNYKSLSNLKVSPNETKAAFIVMQPLLEENSYDRELWIFDFSSQVPVKKVLEQ